MCAARVKIEDGDFCATLVARFRALDARTESHTQPVVADMRCHTQQP
jgi:hypothetical protein